MEKQPFRILGVSVVFHNGWVNSGDYTFELLMTKEPFVCVEYSARQGFYYLYDAGGGLVTGDAVPAGTRVAIYQVTPSIDHEIQKRLDQVQKDLQDINKTMRQINEMLGRAKP